MKRFAVFTVAVLSAMLLASCYVMTTRPTGTIQLNLGTASSRAIDGATADRARIYLYSWLSSTVYSLYPFAAGAEYYEAAYPGTATLSNIPAGWWKVLVSVGTDQADGSFSTDSYGASEVLHVAVGANTSTSINTTPSPFIDMVDVFGKNINSVICSPNNAGFLAASDSNNLYYIDYTDFDPLSGTLTGPLVDILGRVPVPSGYQVNSVGSSPDGYSVLVNTDNGIVTYDGKSFDTGFSKNLIVGGSPVNVLQSAGMVVTSPANRYTLLYTSGRGFGGLSASSWPPASTDWVSIDLSGTTAGPPVYQASMVTTGQGYGYIFLATRLGAFWTIPDLVDSQVTGHGDFGAMAHAFSSPDGATIQAIAVDPGGSVLYVGTPHGAYWTPITMAPRTPPSVSFGSWTKLDAASGDYIIEIQTFGEYVAFRSLYNLYVLDTVSNESVSYPFYAGLPGRLGSMSWTEPTNYGLFIGGSSGIVLLTDPYLPLGPQ